MEYWIQRHDYSVEDFKADSIDEVIEKFMNFAWDNEIRLFRQDDESLDCPFGLGLPISERLLHICLNDLETVFFNYQYKASVKKFGIFPSVKDRIHYVKKYPFNKVPELLRSHAQGDEDEILSIF